MQATVMYREREPIAGHSVDGCLSPSCAETKKESVAQEGRSKIYAVARYSITSTSYDLALYGQYSIK